MIYTIGHSTLSESDFLAVAEPLDEVWDIRSHPSSKWPQFCKENISRWLPDKGKSYVWVPSLGGWTERHLHLSDQYRDVGVDVSVYAKGKFPKQRIASGLERKDKPTWYNQGLWDYQWFMTLDEFRVGVERLIEESKDKNIGIMCCELLWWKCHRSMVADYLLYHDVDCVHLQPKLVSHSKCVGNRLERYESGVLS